MTYVKDEMLNLAARMTDMSEDLISESDIRASTILFSKSKRTGRFSAFMNHPAMVAVLCAVVSLGVVVAIVTAGRGGPFTPPVAETPHIEETVTQEPTDSELIPADFANYESIIRMYHRMVEVLPDWAEKHEELETLFYFPNEQAREWYTRVGNAAFILCPGDRTNGVAHLGYAVKDANGDGVEELLLLSDEFTLIALFTQHDGKPVLLEDFWNRKRGYVNENGQIIICGSSGADVSSREIYRLDATTGQLVLEEALGLDGHTEDLQTIYYHQVGEEKTYISEEEFNELIRKAPYDSYSTEKNRQVLGADYTPISMPVEVSVYFFVGMGGPKAEHIRIYTDPEKINAFADFLTDVLVRSDPPEVPKEPLYGGTHWITLTYENGATQIYGDWGAYIEHNEKWYQLEDNAYRVIDNLFERYESDVELKEAIVRVLAWDEAGFCGEMDDTGKNVYIKGMSTDWFEKYDTVRIVYAVEKLAENEGTVVNDTGETVTYQWVIEDPLSGWKTQ